MFSGVGGISQVTVASVGVCVLMCVEMGGLCFYANPEFAWAAVWKDAVCWIHMPLVVECGS